MGVHLSWMCGSCIIDFVPGGRKPIETLLLQFQQGSASRFLPNIVFLGHWSRIFGILSMDWEDCEKHLCLFFNYLNYISLMFASRNFHTRMHILELFAIVGVLKEKFNV